MKLVSRTDTGNYRKENQDCCATGEIAGGGAWALVCDGMGGAAGGGVAAGSAVDTMGRVLNEMLPGARNAAELRAALRAAVTAANTAVYQEAMRRPELAGMGTTVAAIALKDEDACLAHVGDSRIYRLREGELTLLTRDHSMVQEMVDSGRLTVEEAVNHPKKNYITRALGVESTVEGDYTPLNLRQGDYFLLCSDGLHNAVPVDEIVRILKEIPFYAAADTLVRAAVAAGGRDNITTVLVKAAPEDTEED